MEPLKKITVPFTKLPAVRAESLPGQPKIPSMSPLLTTTSHIAMYRRLKDSVFMEQKTPRAPMRVA
jgi:hypothetical protein